MLHLLPELQEMEKSIMTFLTFACTFVMQAQCNCFIVLLAISVQILELWNLEVSMQWELSPQGFSFLLLILLLLSYY